MVFLCKDIPRLSDDFETNRTIQIDHVMEHFPTLPQLLLSIRRIGPQFFNPRRAFNLDESIINLLDMPRGTTTLRPRWIAVSKTTNAPLAARPALHDDTVAATTLMLAALSKYTMKCLNRPAPPFCC